MWKFLVGLFTEDSGGKIACPVRVFGSGGVGAAVGLQGYAVFALHQHFDVQAFCFGIAALIGALAGGIAYKHAKGADTD